MVSSNINHVGRIAEADIHALTVTSEKDERNTKPLFKDEPDTKPNKISIDLNLNLIFCRGRTAVVCSMAGDELNK